MVSPELRVAHSATAAGSNGASSRPPRIEPALELLHPAPLGSGKISRLPRIVDHVIKLDDTVRDIDRVGHDQLPISRDDPPVSKTRAGSLMSTAL